MVVNKQPADVQNHLSDHILDEVRVGNTKNELEYNWGEGSEPHTCGENGKLSIYLYIFISESR